MKKPSIDPRAIREFFVYHIEKFIFVGAILGLMVFAYSAIGRERLSFSPGDLVRATEEAKRSIQEGATESKLEPTNFIEVAKRVKIPIDKTHYLLKSAWDPPLFPSKGLREQPTVLPFEEVRGVAGFGPVSMKTGRAGEKRRQGSQGQRWVVLTGLIPVTKQQNIYNEAFEDAKHLLDREDTPTWVHFSVERAEVSGPDDISPPKWLGMNEKFALAVKDRWNSEPKEVVDERFLYSSRAGIIPMAFPLAPIQGRRWDSSVAHPPQIPLEATERAKTNELGEMIPGMDEETEPGNEDPFSDDEPELPDKIGGAEDENDFRGEMMDGVGMGDDFFGVDGNDRARMNRDELEESPYCLFRFFDFYVEPGKFYRYRVRPLLYNPNNDVADQYLADLKFKVGKTIPVDPNDAWSQPTDVISVPQDARVLAGPATSSLNPNTKPKIEVGISFFHMPTGATEFDTFEAVRGQRLNFPKRPLTPNTEVAVAETTEETVDFFTHHTILDIQGGRRLSGRSKMIEPSLLLMLDPYGNLVVANEVESQKEYREQKGKETDKSSRSTDREEYPFPGMEDYEGNMGDLFE